MTIPTLSMAKDRVPEVNTGNKKLDSLLIAINRNFEISNDSIIDRLSAQVYIKGSSQNIHLGKSSKYLTSILPFEGHHDRTTVFESVCQLDYQDPCQLQFTPLALRTNNRSGRKYLRESFQVLLPMYSFKRMKDKGSNKSYVVPFSDEGLNKYTFTPTIDTIYYQDKPHMLVNFQPRHEHHTLGRGYFVVDSLNIVKALMFSGRVDFGKVDYFLTLEKDEKSQQILPVHNHASISYNYAGQKGVNEFDCHITFDQLTTKSRKHNLRDKLDLTDIYDKDYGTIDIEKYRPIPLTAEEDSMLQTSNTKSLVKQRNSIQRLPEMLVGSSNINAFGNNLKIYGPLDPASFSYDKINGFTIRQKLRFSRVFDSGKSFMLKPDFGYSFGMKEFRYKTSFEWIYNPRKRGGFSISASNRSSEFSSKFRDEVNEVLKDTSALTFKDLGIDYYRRHEAKVEHSYELLNGLMMYTGVSYNYRDPVKHGSRAMSQDRIDALVKDHYADFSPYLRLTWTPRQYYHYEKNQKLYIASYCPTFSLELARGLKHVFGSTSDYGRIEFDVQQTIKLDNMRSFSYHVGTGSFLNQKGEYFINYSFFSRSMFPSTWDDHIGGVFTLMDDYWYNSTPRYFQTHLMYESPFLLLHQAKPISKYVIKERVYLSHLWAEDKNAYSEFGYGMGNNYFNIGVFTSFIGLKINEVGVKASIEIDSHW